MQPEEVWRTKVYTELFETAALRKSRFIIHDSNKDHFMLTSSKKLTVLECDIGVLKELCL